VSDVFFTRAGKLAARKVAGEVVILRADDSSLYVLNPVATAVWEAADGRTSLDAVVRDVICRDYDVDPDTALRDASEFVVALAAQGILRTSDQPLLPADQAPDVERDGART
jgi:Coenzyme PQQ synthesis protein D (PqqD)